VRIDQILATRTEPVFSFEFFPPKSEQGARNLDAAVRALRPLEPAFVSVTKTGTSTQAETIELVRRIRADNDFEAAAHFTCAGATRNELRTALDLVCDSGLENVLALRGDPPSGEAFAAHDGGFAHASDLVEMIRSDYDLCTVAACYPERHPEAPDAESDLAHLCRKVEAGANVLITNLFFSNPAFFEFERRARAAGITVPIVPGIMPITRADQIKRFTAIGGITIPPNLLRELDARGDDLEAVADLGVAYATLQCAELLAAGLPGIHFYTLNRSPATRAILSALRLLRPWETARA
jgi:methylenetetrahydrofolate reductase (NADPH)